ncbi:MAG TPA: hypothetical protein VLR52_05765, partial [Bacteroidales bacterium]|nr:hypothetical protein [Bacteroidales bacterium]
MKPTLKALSYAITLAGVIVFAYPGRLFSQDTVAKKNHKTMIVKIESDENGKKTVLDTTINLDQVANMKDLQEFMKKYDVDLRELAGNLGNMEININRMGIPDSAWRDSIRNFTKNII